MLDAFRPTWRRIAVAVVVAGAAFLLPQEAPLEYYPLNHPSDVYYLEITCQASVEGETRIYLDTGRGFNDLQSIRIPIAPSKQPYTYTFPLWDAPLKGLRLEPLNKPGKLTVTNMRIFTRSGREIRRFTGDDFDATHEIARIAPTANGWEYVTTPDAHRPYSLCGLFPPIIPAGMNERNSQRCLLSWSYLAGMLWILLLAVLFVAQWRSRARDKGNEGMREEGASDREQEAGGSRPVQPTAGNEKIGDKGRAEGKEQGQANKEKGDAALPLLPHSLYSSLPQPKAAWRCLARDALFLAFLALLFSAVGNRGLIKDSIRYARFPVEPVKPGLRLEIDLAADPPYIAQLFWDTGRGFTGEESQRRNYESHTLYQTLRFDLPDLGKVKESLHALRFDPFDAAGTIRIFGIRVIDQGRRTRLRLPPNCLRAERDIASIEIQDQQVVIRTTPTGSDPILEFTPAAVRAVAEVMRTAAERGSEGARE